MDTIENMRALLAIARLKSFAAAAEELDLAASVVTKRVGQLERTLKSKLLARSTRKVALTPEGEHHLQRIESIVAAYDQTVAVIRGGMRQLEGPIRIKVPTTLGAMRLNKRLRQFAAENPGVKLEILLLDGPLNPAAEGVDIAITAFPVSFDGVADEYLWSIGRVLVATPGYLSRHDELTHPRQLERHDCIVYQPTGASWPFLSKSGVVTVSVPATLSSNDMSMLLDAVIDGEGIAMLSKWIAQAEIDSGRLHVALPAFPVPDVWLKAMIPVERLAVPRIASLLRYLRTDS